MWFNWCNRNAFVKEINFWRKDWLIDFVINKKNKKLSEFIKRFKLKRSQSFKIASELKVWNSLEFSKHNYLKPQQTLIFTCLSICENSEPNSYGWDLRDWHVESMWQLRWEVGSGRTISKQIVCLIKKGFNHC